MSELLDTLNAPSEAPPKTWEQEVAEAGANAPQSVPEPAAPAPAPVAPETAEAAPEAPQAQETASEETDRRVPLKALQEERQKRAEAERKAAEVERRIAELTVRLEQIAPKQPAQPEAPPPPDPETDPIGALKYQNEMLQSLRNREEQARYEQELQATAYRAATEFAAQAPDYRDAYKYAVDTRAVELSILGVPNDEIPAILKREELSLIANAKHTGRNPAQIIYEFAKARGYQGPQAAPAPAPAPVAVAPAPIAPQPAPVNPALQQAKAAVAVSAAAGGAPAAKGELTDKEFSELKGAAFDAAWNKRFGGNKSSLFRD